MKSLNMQISAASTSSVGANLPQVSSLGAGLISHLPVREFSICGLCCCLCTAPAPPKAAAFPWKTLLPGSVCCSRKGSKSTGCCEPQVRLGDDFPLLLSLPARELMQHLQQGQGRGCPWGCLWHPELARSSGMELQGWSWSRGLDLGPGTSFPLDCWGWGCCAGRMHREQAGASGNKYKGKLSPSLEQELECSKSLVALGGGYSDGARAAEQPFSCLEKKKKKSRPILICRGSRVQAVQGRSLEL